MVPTPFATSHFALTRIYCHRQVGGRRGGRIGSPALRGADCSAAGRGADTALARLPLLSSDMRICVCVYSTCAARKTRRSWRCCAATRRQSSHPGRAAGRARRALQQRQRALWRATTRGRAGARAGTRRPLPLKDTCTTDRPTSIQSLDDMTLAEFEFQRTVSLEPRQVLRYCYGGSAKPLPTRPAL